MIRKHLRRYFSLLLLTLFCLPAIAAPLTFSLQRLDNEQVVTVTEKDFDNQYLLIAIGYTSCPDVCPLTLLDIRNTLKALDEHPDIISQLQPLFITIDPISDSLSAVSQYAAFFDRRIIGLRGEDFSALDDVIEQLHASYGYQLNGKPVLPPDLPDGYTVMHSTFIYLYGPKGELIDAYPYNMDVQRLANNLLKHLSP